MILRADERTLLRSTSERDAAPIFALVEANRVHLRRWLGWVDGVREVAHIREFLHGVAIREGDGASLELAIEHEGELAGIAGFRAIDARNRAAEIGYWLRADREGRGIVTACCRALVRHGFAALELNRIALAAAAENTRSRRVAERLGFRLDGGAARRRVAVRPLRRPRRVLAPAPRYPRAVTPQTEAGSGALAGSADPGRVSRRRLAAAVALAGALTAGLFIRIGADQKSPAPEARCLAVVTEMVRSGDWLVPRLEGVPRLQKPPLYYWAGAAATELSGSADLTTLRSVSAFAALLLALAVFAVGRSLGDFAAGAAGTAALGADALFYVRGRMGDAEMLLALFVFLALAVFERLWRTRERRLLPLLALLVGLAFLTKATAALLSIAAPIAVWLALQRRLRLALRPAVLGWGMVALAIGVSWYAAILLRVPDAVALFREYLIGPLGVHAQGADATHVREIYYYWPRFPLLSAPAGLLLPWIAYDAWRQRLWRGDPSTQFFALAFVTLLVAWSLVPSKQIHYLLPLVPLQSVVIGRLVALRLGAAKT
ncbi:MAG: GNAT family N-acetyltransferase [Myxococcota bacterium]